MLYSGLDEVPGASDEKKSEEDSMSLLTETVYHHSQQSWLLWIHFPILSTKENKDLTVISQTWQTIHPLYQNGHFLNENSYKYSHTTGINVQ